MKKVTHFVTEKIQDLDRIAQDKEKKNQHDNYANMPYGGMKEKKARGREGTSKHKTSKEPKLGENFP